MFVFRGYIQNIWWSDLKQTKEYEWSFLFKSFIHKASQAEQVSTSDTSSVVSLDNVSAQSPNFLARSNSENPLPFKNWFMLNVRISSYGRTREVWRAREKRTPRTTLSSWVLSKLSKCIHNSIYAQLKAWTNSFATYSDNKEMPGKQDLVLINYKILSMCCTEKQRWRWFLISV